MPAIRNFVHINGTQKIRQTLAIKLVYSGHAPVSARS